jgi:transcriptional regulator with XRE-family HTH domain
MEESVKYDDGAESAQWKIFKIGHVKLKDNMKEFDKNLGKKLRELRLKHGYSQTDIGNIIGVSFQQVQKQESGTNRVSVRVVCMLQKLYSVSWEEILDICDITLPQVRRSRPLHAISNSFQNIPSQATQQALFALVRTLSASSGSRQSGGNREAMHDAEFEKESPPPFIILLNC